MEDSVRSQQSVAIVGVVYYSAMIAGRSLKGYSRPNSRTLQLGDWQYQSNGTKNHPVYLKGTAMPRRKPKPYSRVGTERQLEPDGCIYFHRSAKNLGGYFCNSPAEHRDSGRGLLFCDSCWEVVEGHLSSHKADSVARRYSVIGR